MARFPRPVITRMSVIPAPTASSTTYWMVGLSMTGTISFGWLLVAGRNLVPSPAAGITAFRTFVISAGAPHHRVGLFDPVAAVLLGPLQGLLGGGQQCADASPAVGIGGNAERQGDRPGAAVVLHRLLAHRPADLLGQDPRAGQVGLGQEQHELLTAVAGHDVDLPGGGREPL